MVTHIILPGTAHSGMTGTILLIIPIGADMVVIMTDIMAVTMDIIILIMITIITTEIIMDHEEEYQQADQLQIVIPGP